LVYFKEKVFRVVPTDLKFTIFLDSFLPPNNQVHREFSVRLLGQITMTKIVDYVYCRIYLS